MKAALANFLPFVGYAYEGETVACNLCGSTETVDICARDRRLKPLKTVACADCGLLRTDPMPTDAELEIYYASQYRLDYQLASSRPPKFHIVRSMREAEERAARLDRWLGPGRKVLDLGCGTGEFLHLAKARGCDVVGVEPGASYAAFARSEYGLEVLTDPWRKLDFADASFDVITSRHVLEHLRDPVDAIGAMARWLKPDGAVFLSMPNMRPDERPNFERFHFAHVHGFTPETLEAAARRHALAPVGQGPLVATTAVFEKVERDGVALDAGPGAIRDRARAIALQRGFAGGSVARFVASGAYFRAAGGRLRRWLRDSRAGIIAVAQSILPLAVII